MVKCAECGFLCFRDRGTFELVEAVESIRSATVIPNALVYQRPYCFVRKVDFAQEYGWEPRALDAAEGGVFTAISAERECDGFEPWQQGFTPQEHREMLDRDRMIKREDEIRRAIWEREDRRDVEVGQQHKEQMDTLRGQHWWQIAVLGGAVIVATLIGAMIQAGWFAKPW